MKNQKALGDKILKIIEARNTSVYAINKHTGLSYPIINSIINGDKNYTISSLVKVLNFLNYEIFFKDVKK